MTAQRTPCADEQALDALEHALGALPLSALAEGATLAVGVDQLRRVLKLAHRGFALRAARRGQLIFVGEHARVVLASADDARSAGALLFQTVALVRVDDTSQGEGSPEPRR